MKKILFTIITGTPSDEERVALEQALLMHERPVEESATKKSVWAAPNLRRPLKKSL